MLPDDGMQAVVAPNFLALSLILALTAACGGSSVGPSNELLRAALVAFPAKSPLDREIARAQEQVRRDGSSLPALERLGTLLIAKARVTHDAGWFKLAEQTALAMEQREPGDHSALLLRGHVLHSLHDFAAAEAIAKTLTEKRGTVHDHGLLGDVLYDVGRLPEAAASYQRMLDLKPCLQSYARAAQMRWIKGDLQGARGLLELAVGAGSTRDADALAWTHSRLAAVAMQMGDFKTAENAIMIALGLQPNHAGALVTKARLALAPGLTPVALDSATAAVAASSEVEPRWVLADCLRLAGREMEARTAEAELEKTGAEDDPRTFALYLATRGKDLARAHSLAKKELFARHDPMTQDAVAFTALATGDRDLAKSACEKALAAGTQDARLFVHAALVASAAGDRELARKHRESALRLAATLLPSERALVERIVAN